MILGDSEIRKLIKEGYLPRCNEKLINPASLNVRIGFTFLVPHQKPNGIALGDKVEYDTVTLKQGETFTLAPSQFALATTVEKVNLPPAFAAFVQGRSSIGRVGLSVQNAGFIDPGFHGHITLELKNETHSPIIIRPGYPVAQLVIVRADGVETPYDGKYNEQVEATGSRMHLDDIAELLR